MKRSTNRILTTHVGSLPRPDDLLALNSAIYGEREYDREAYQCSMSDAVAGIARKQADIGVDVVNDGEFGKASRGATDYGPWVSYAWRRLSGWEFGAAGIMPSLARRRDWQRFARVLRRAEPTLAHVQQSIVRASSVLHRPGGVPRAGSAAPGYHQPQGCAGGRRGRGCLHDLRGAR